MAYRAQHQRTWYVNQVSRNKYGTDVPTLQSEVRRLEREVHDRTRRNLEYNREMNDLRRRHDRLKDNYSAVFNAYDRAMDLLQRERRRWRR